MTTDVRVLAIQACDAFLEEKQEFRFGFCRWAEEYTVCGLYGRRAFEPGLKIYVEGIGVYHLIGEIRKELMLQGPRAGGSDVLPYVDTPGVYSESRVNMVRDIRAFLLADL